MNAADIIFAQNWIEQFRREQERNAQNAFERQFYYDPFRRSQTPDIIAEAFSWGSSLQGYSQWEGRFYQFERSDAENILTL